MAVMLTNQSKVTRRWQTVIPAAIRKELNVKEGDRLVWIVDGKSIRVVALSANPLRALRGTAKGEKLQEKLMAERKQERARERR